MTSSDPNAHEQVVDSERFCVAVGIANFMNTFDFIVTAHIRLKSENIIMNAREPTECEDHLLAMKEALNLL